MGNHSSTPVMTGFSSDAGVYERCIGRRGRRTSPVQARREAWQARARGEDVRGAVADASDESDGMSQEEVSLGSTEEQHLQVHGAGRHEGCCRAGGSDDDDDDDDDDSALEELLHAESVARYHLSQARYVWELDVNRLLASAATGAKKVRFAPHVLQYQVDSPQFIVDEPFHSRAGCLSAALPRPPTAAAPAPHAVPVHCVIMSRGSVAEEVTYFVQAHPAPAGLRPSLKQPLQRQQQQYMSA